MREFAGTLQQNAYLRNSRTVIKETEGNCLTCAQGWYNCGSFALGVWDRWYLPYRDGNYDICRDTLDAVKTIEEQYIEDYGWDCSLDEYDSLCDDVADEYVRSMENTLTVREIQQESDLREDEYLVLFRAALDDFHYVRKFSDGTYWHKMGRQLIQQITKEDAYSEDWWRDHDYIYAGRTRLLAVPKGGARFV